MHSLLNFSSLPGRNLKDNLLSQQKAYPSLFCLPTINAIILKHEN